MSDEAPEQFYTEERWQNWLTRVEEEELDPENEMAYHVRGRWHYGVADLNWIERAVVKTVYGGLPDASFEQAARDLEKARDLNPEMQTFEQWLAVNADRIPVQA